MAARAQHATELLSLGFFDLMMVWLSGSRPPVRCHAGPPESPRGRAEKHGRVLSFGDRNAWGGGKRGRKNSRVCGRGGQEAHSTARKVREIHIAINGRQLRNDCLRGGPSRFSLGAVVAPRWLARGQPMHRRHRFGIPEEALLRKKRRPGSFHGGQLKEIGRSL